jgi:hypothetical protein
VEVNNLDKCFKISDLILNNVVRQLVVFREFPVHVLGPESDSLI